MDISGAEGAFGDIEEHAVIFVSGGGVVKLVGADDEVACGSVDEVGICAQICTTIIKLDLAIGTGGRGSSSGAAGASFPVSCAVIIDNTIVGSGGGGIDIVQIVKLHK